MSIQIEPPFTVATKHRVRSTFATGCVLALLSIQIAAAPLSAQTMGDHHSLRELTGIVTDPQHEPLRGAVVELQESGSAEIVTFITGNDGKYLFKRLDSDQDYTVWVLFRNRHSKSRSISKFDDHMNKVENFTVETF